jgi:hypothetical protein
MKLAGACARPAASDLQAFGERLPARDVLSEVLLELGPLGVELLGSGRVACPEVR